MWENLTRADVEDAKAQVAEQRRALLARQSEELRGLDAEEAEIAQLGKLIADFAAKFGGRPQALPADGDTTAAEAAPTETKSKPGGETQAAAGRPTSPTPTSRTSGSDRATGKRNPSQSNFDTFARALSNSI